VADSPHGEREQLLNERELAVIRELARAVVREAGIARDPESDALLEKDKAKIEFFRTVLLLDSALLAGAAAVGAFVPDPNSLGLLVWGFALVVISLATCFIGLYGGTEIIGVHGGTPMSFIPRLRARTFRDVFQALTVSFVGPGILLFIQFVFLNLPENLN
jgi:hypothetical protein